MKGLVNMTNKMTKREVLNAMLNDSNFTANADFVAYANHELELLDKKAESKTPTKIQMKNEELKVEILDLMIPNSAYTCTQIVKMLNSEDVQSTQKGTALLKALADEGKVEIIRDKKSTFYKRVA
jgi:predicted HTH transcriptional regulator